RAWPEAQEESLSWPNLHEWNFGDSAGRKSGVIHLEIVGVEAHRHIKQEASCNGRAARRNVAGEEIDHPCRWIDDEPDPLFQLIFRHSNTHAVGNGLHNRPAVRCIKRTIDLAELERLGDAVSCADDLVGRCNRMPRSGRGMVKPVAPAETVKPPSPLLEKGEYLRQRFESLHAITRIVTSAGMRPSRVA